MWIISRIEHKPHTFWCDKPHLLSLFLMPLAQSHHSVSPKVLALCLGFWEEVSKHNELSSSKNCFANSFHTPHFLLLVIQRSCTSLHLKVLLKDTPSQSEMACPCCGTSQARDHHTRALNMLHPPHTGTNMSSRKNGNKIMSNHWILNNYYSVCSIESALNIINTGKSSAGSGINLVNQQNNSHETPLIPFTPWFYLNTIDTTLILTTSYNFNWANKEDKEAVG